MLFSFASHTPRSVISPRHQISRRHVKPVVCGGTFIRRNPDRDVSPIKPAVGLFYFFRAALFDRNFLQSVPHFPVDRGRRQRNVKRNVVGLRRQGFEICADLIRNISRVRGAIAPDNDQIDFAALHQMARRAVGDYRVRHAMLAQFPCSEFRTLASGSGLSHPHVQRQSVVVRGVNQAQSLSHNQRMPAIPRCSE